MKSCKRILAVILCVIMFATAVPMTNVFADDIVASGTCGDFLTWELDDEGTLTISGEGEMSWYSWHAPWNPNRYNIKTVVIENGITSIGYEAFEDCRSLSSITIPDSVTSIHISAFEDCSSLSNVTIPDGVTSIDNRAFSGCSNLPSVTIPDSVTRIEAYAFQNCSSLASITIGNSVTSIGNDAFENCSSLTNITIPDSVTSIGGSAFENCSSLTNITIGNSVTSISFMDFSSCSSLISIMVDENNPNYSSKDDVLFNKEKTKLLKYPTGNIRTEYTIPDSVTSIGDYAFKYCSNLKSVIIPDSITNIGGNEVFYGCSSLTSIIVDKNNPDYSSIDGVLFNKDKTKLIQYPIGNIRTKYTIPDSVTIIGHGAFEDCSSLTSLTIPDSVIDIDWSAFEDCSNLTSVTIGNSVKYIDLCAFSGCSSLTSITIYNSDCEIYDDSDTIPKKTVIYGYKDSTAEAYANEYSRTFVCLDSETPTDPTQPTEPSIESSTEPTTEPTTSPSDNNTSKQSFVEKVKAFFQRIIDWFKNLFKR